MPSRALSGSTKLIYINVIQATSGHCISAVDIYAEPATTRLNGDKLAPLRASAVGSNYFRPIPTKY